MLNKRFGRVLFCCGYFCFVLDIFLLVHGLGQGFNVVTKLSGDCRERLKTEALTSGVGRGVPQRFLGS